MLGHGNRALLISAEQVRSPPLLLLLVVVVVVEGLAGVLRGCGLSVTADRVSAEGTVVGETENWKVV